MKFVPRQLEETADVSRGRVRWRRAARNTLGVVAVLVLLYFGLGLAASLLARSIPDSWEAKFLAVDLEMSGVGDARLHGPPAFQRAREIFERLAGSDGLRDLDYRLWLIEMDAPNAFAVPGGGVGVTTGLLERVDSEIGLAAVLGHELGHHQSRHCLERLGRMLLIRAAVALLFGDGGGAIESTVELAERKYSRDQEREADDFGLRLVHATYGHTDGSLQFFEMVQREFERGSATWTALGATHPPTAERIAALRALQRELEESDGRDERVR